MSSPTCRHVTLARSGVARAQQRRKRDCASRHLGPALRSDRRCLEALRVLRVLPGAAAAAALHVRRGAQLAMTRGRA